MCLINDNTPPVNMIFIRLIHRAHPKNYAVMGTDICSTSQQMYKWAYNVLKWIVEVLVCRRFGLSTLWFVDVLVCRRFGLSTFWVVDVLVVNVSVWRRFDQLPSTFRCVDVSVCRRFCLSTFWSVDVLVCRRFGLSTFWSVDVSVCRRFGLSTFSLSTFRFVDVLTSYHIHYIKRTHSLLPTPGFPLSKIQYVEPWDFIDSNLYHDLK